MTLQVFTARMGSRDPDWLDVTRKGTDERIAKGEVGGHRGVGEAFAPSPRLFRYYRGMLATSAGQPSDLQWLEIRSLFIGEMRTSYRVKRVAWDQVLELPRVVLLCFCTDPARCHRRILAEDVLPKLGAVNRGELTG